MLQRTRACSRRASGCLKRRREAPRAILSTWVTKDSGSQGSSSWSASSVWIRSCWPRNGPSIRPPKQATTQPPCPRAWEKERPCCEAHGLQRSATTLTQVDDDLDERRRMRAWGHPRGTRFAIPKDLWCMRQTAIRKRTQRSRFPPDRRKRSVAPRRMPPVPARFAGRAIYCTFARRRRHAFEDTPHRARSRARRRLLAPGMF